MDTAGLIPALIPALTLALAAAAAPQSAPETRTPARTAPAPAAPAPAAPAPATNVADDPAVSGQQPVRTPVVPSPEAAPAVRCDAASWRWLRGRSLNELLAQRLPEGSRIVRVGDAPLPADAIRGRLVVEIGRNTRVRRVFCG